MKKLLLILLSFWSACVMADISLTITDLHGYEQQLALSQLGKITFENGVMYLYDKTGSLLGYTDVEKVGKIVVEEVPSALCETNDEGLVIYPDLQQECLIVKNLQGKQLVRVFSLLGNLVSECLPLDGEAHVYLNGLAKGAYLLQVGAQVVKFVK